MQDYKHEYTTTLNGGVITVVIDVTWERDDEGFWEASFSLDSVLFDEVDVLPILDQNTQTALEMEAENAIRGDAGDFNPARDAFQLGE